MEMKWNSSHQGDDDGSEVPHRESKRRCSLADVGDARMFEATFEAMARSVVREEVDKKFAPIHHSSSRSSFDQFDPSQRRGCQLHFDGKLPDTLYTFSRIESEDGKAVKIVLRDASKEIISAGPLSSMKVEIVPLDGDFGANDQGDWTEQEFKAKIVHAREGKRQLVTGKSVITLRNGVGEIKVSFTDNSGWTRSGRFRLGARADSSNSNEVRVREARSEPLRVKDQRGESYKKHHPPHLGDEIWRLEKISKGGVTRKRLFKNRITTIEHFLRSYYMDESSLRKLFGRISDKRWKTITEHATACVPDDKLYRYHREGEMRALVFNSVFKVVGVTLDGQYYQSLEMLESVHKDWVEKMKSHAYKNMNDFVQLDPLSFPSLPSNLLADPFANPSASLQHLSFAGENQDPPDISPASNLLASPECTGFALDYSLPGGSAAPCFPTTDTSFCNNWPPSMQIGENYQAETSTWGRNGLFFTPSRGGEVGILSPKSGRRKAWWFMVRAAFKWVMSPRRTVAAKEWPATPCCLSF